jgi:hypothetical protein
MSTYPDQSWLARSNELALYHVERQGRTGPGLVPFLGAGASQAFGYEDWKTLLTRAAPPGQAAAVAEQLGRADYEGAAETLLKALGADGFQNMVAAAAGDSRLRSADFRTGTVSLLPLLARGPVVTTNFDRVLEHAFAANGAPFESVISGPRPDLIVDALHGDRRVLVKLHGDWQDRVGRTFARSDYEDNYGAAELEGKRVLLPAVEELLFSSRSMLFIGASLGPDRTVEVLKAAHKRYAGVRHFTITAVPGTREVFDETEANLRECGVLPLWYQVDESHGHAGQVEALVEQIIERISVQTIAGPGPRKPECAQVAPPEVAPSEAGAAPDFGPLDRVVRLVEDGRLNFFLGSAIHLPTELLAQDFNVKLAVSFQCEPLTRVRDAVAQYISDRYGRETLNVEIRKLLRGTAFVPRNTHELFAAWDTFRTPEGRKVPYPLVLTTNYDDVLERRLSQAGVPYHLLSYQAHGPSRGLFYHQAPDNSLRVIERPRNIRKLPGAPSDAFVVVRLAGGVDCQGRIPESYASARLDFLALASGIPDVLPAALQERLTANPLLFLGHGLATPDVESLIRFAHRERPGPRSWAVALNMGGVEEYWRQCGVEILDAHVHLYVNKLRERLAANGPAAGPSLASPSGT